MLVVVQVGQCGNQVGASFWRCVGDQLNAAGQSGAAESLWSLVQPAREGRAPRARCVLVDSEPKAARGGAQGESLLAAAPLVSAQAGRGGNWAAGYALPGESAGETERSLLARALQAVRRETERCPSTPDLLLLLGTAGGTCGGLGCRLLEALRSEHGQTFIGVCAVGLGESALLAPLGDVLCVQFLQAYADLVLLFQSEELLGRLERAARCGGAPTPRVTLSDVNAALGRRLAAALLPLDAGAPPLRDMVTSVCPWPALKFADLRSAAAAHSSFETDAAAWSTLASALAAEAPRRDLSTGAPFSASASLLTLRGPGAALPVAAASAAAALTRAAWPVVRWGDDAPEVRVSSRAALCLGAPRSGALISNRSSCLPPLRRAAEGAGALLECGAYLHWFSRHGVCRQALEDGLEATRTVIDAYEEAHAQSC